jgi:pimeloyl-ACP methyl ester carboxylesterase
MIEKPQGPPSALLLAAEARAAFDVIGAVAGAAGDMFRSTLPPKDPPVIMFPGFAASERSLQPLQTHLRKRGYRAEGWGLGYNFAGANLPHTLDDLAASWEVEHKPDYKGEGGVPYLCDLAAARVKLRAEYFGKPVALVGWSLGGYIAREVARELPELVNNVITMGSPVIGGPRYTRAAPAFERRGQDMQWIEDEIEKRNKRPIQQPITALFSKSDGIVDWRAAMDHHSPNVNHVEVNVAHLGFGFNRSVWRYVLTALDA